MYSDRHVEIEKFKTQRKRKKRAFLSVVFLLVLMLAAAAMVFMRMPSKKVAMLSETEIPEWIDVQLLSPEGTSRRGEKLENINSIVIHYVGNPGSTAQNNRNYFAAEGVTVNSHFIVGLEGEIIQCIPLDEKSSASNHRNRDTISIEVCHPDETGEFSKVTYDALVKLTAWLCEVCDFDEDDIIRHYDVTGKICPMYYVEHENAWLEFKEEVFK